MVISTRDSVDLRDPVLISGILRFKKGLHQSPLVATSFDYTTLMERYVEVTWKNRDLEDILSDPLIANRFVEQFMAKLQEQPTGLITPDLRKARVTIIGPVLTVRQLEKNMVPVEASAKKEFGNKADLSIAGYPSLHIKIMNYAFTSMKSGLYSALILVFISMLFMLRSVRMALIALAPNVFPVVLLLGFLGISGIYLDLATCTATAIVMGIAIDDTIYFLNKFQEFQKKGGDLMECIENTHKRVGKVILISSLVMIAGYSVMLTASLKTVIYFGLLSIVAVFAAVLGDLVVLPLLLKVAGMPKDKKAGAITSTVS
jgi:predicted RND superfamily exporter protein